MPGTLSAQADLVKRDSVRADSPRPPSTSPSTSPPPATVTRGDLGKLAFGVGLAALAYRADASVRREVRSVGWQRSDALSALADIGNGWGQPGVVGLGIVLWGGGLYTRNATVATVGLRALEAITVSSTVTKLLKGTVGRARPRVSPGDPWDVEFGRGFSSGSGYESMPSGHSTAAFAFAAAVTSEVARRAPERARLIGATTFGLATATAYARMHRDAHWLSDVTMGAAIGMVSGWAVTRWHATRPGNRVDEILLRPVLGPSPSGRTRIGVELQWP